MIENPRERIVLSILNAFVIISAAVSATFTISEIGFLPVLALAIKGFLLGSALASLLYLASNMTSTEDESEIEELPKTRSYELSFFLGYSLLSLFVSIFVITFAGLIFFTTLLFFLVGALMIFSGASSKIISRADDFVEYSARVGIALFLIVMFGPGIWIVIINLAMQSPENASATFSLIGFILLLGVVFYIIIKIFEVISEL